jgi:hypothetical protein
MRCRGFIEFPRCDGRSPMACSPADNVLCWKLADEVIE